MNLNEFKNEGKKIKGRIVLSRLGLRLSMKYIIFKKKNKEIKLFQNIHLCFL